MAVLISTIHPVEAQACRLLGIAPFRVVTNEDVRRFREQRRLERLALGRQRQPR